MQIIARVRGKVGGGKNGLWEWGGDGERENISGTKSKMVYETRANVTSEKAVS